jgi:predicted hydrocarbon binding protein
LKVTPEQRFGIVVPTLMQNMERIAKAVDLKFRAEGQALLKHAMRERGIETGKVMKALCPEEDPRSVGAFFSHVTRLFGVSNNFEVRGNEVLVKITKCPYGLENTNRGLCEAMMAFDVGAVEALGPNLIMEIVKTVAVGDTECEISIRNK